MYIFYLTVLITFNLFNIYIKKESLINIFKITQAIGKKSFLMILLEPKNKNRKVASPTIFSHLNVRNSVFYLISLHFYTKKNSKSK